MVKKKEEWSEQQQEDLSEWFVNNVSAKIEIERDRKTENLESIRVSATPASAYYDDDNDNDYKLLQLTVYDGNIEVWNETYKCPKKVETLLKKMREMAEDYIERDQGRVGAHQVLLQKMKAGKIKLTGITIEEDEEEVEIEEGTKKKHWWNRS